MKKIATLVAAFALVLVAGAPALADGDGSSPECMTGLQGSGDGDLQTFTAGEGEIVEGVCIKAGQLHTPPLGNGLHEDECYEVSGVGTQTVTVERVGDVGRECQEISHIDVLVTDEPPDTTTTTTDPETPTTTTVPETTTTVPETTTTDPETTTTVPVTVTTDPETPTTTPSELPETGANVSSFVVAGLVLLMSGGLILLGITRRAENI